MDLRGLCPPHTNFEALGMMTHISTVADWRVLRVNVNRWYLEDPQISTLTSRKHNGTDAKAIAIDVSHSSGYQPK